MSYEKISGNINYKMIYKLNENKKEKKNKMEKLRDNEEFFLYDEREYEEDIIRIFGKYFVKENKNKCKIIYNNKKYKLKEYFEEIDKDYNSEIDEIKLKLVGINQITNLKEIFYGCYYLSSVSESQNENAQNNFTKFEYFTSNNNSTLSDLNNSSIYLNKIINMSYMFSGCISLKSISDISKFNTFEMHYMDGVFKLCNSLIS